MKKLHIMSGIHLMNRDNIGGVVIERGEPFLLFFRWPIIFRRSEVVISFGGAFLEWTGSIHRGTGSGTQVLRRFLYFRASLGRNFNQLTIEYVLANLVQVFGDVRDQFVRGGMLTLDRLKNLNGRVVCGDLFFRFGGR